MAKLRSFHYALLASFTLAVLIHAQDQSGFISIDCGIPAGSVYDDKTTGIKYISDANFTDAGITRSILPEFQISNLERQFYNVRSFPEGQRNCYTLNNIQGKNDKYLIRARFMYGNYDNQNNVPQFDMYLGVNLWKTVKLNNASSILTTEILLVPSTNYIFICLVNTGQGTPFISSLEVRLLNSSIYTTWSQSESLVLQGRYDCGSTTNQSVRYPDDIYDRIWQPLQFFDNWKILSTQNPVDDRTMNSSSFRPPSAVMRTAVVPLNGTRVSFYWSLSTDPNFQYYSYMHFAEVEALDNYTRKLQIYQNEAHFYGPLVPRYLSTNTIYSRRPVKGGTVDIEITKDVSSDLPPILNAIEIYMAKEYSQLQTDQYDVLAIMKIKSKYGVTKNWQGDPCAPKGYWWDGLTCSYNNTDTPRIISLNMSSSGLTGEIAPYFADLTLLEHLDLSDNSLTGTVPGILAQLQSLTTLNLKRNKLKGSLPAELLERSKNGLLTLSVEDNPNICRSDSCERKKNKFVFPVIGALAALCTLLIAWCVFRCITRKNNVPDKVEIELEDKNDSFASKIRKLTYSDILRITNNYERVVGRGGFGAVYLGYLDDTEVAVKMLSPSSAQGYKEFHAEVKLLMRAHHKNLTSFIGYCMEGTNMGLIYEYMAKGNLENYLSGGEEHILSWWERLQIAVDAAQGLEYLHNGCKPPIVHRDVKPANILLNEKFQAKITDFGLSRIFSTESGTNISTEQFAGTPGYLDPEFSMQNRLCEKSDVYSFGVVLLKIITTQPVIAKISFKNVHITQWVKSMLAEGDIRKIVDSRLGGNFNINSAWRAVELALACVSNVSSERPTMAEVVMGLKECVAIENSRNSEGLDKLFDSVNVDTELSPLAR